MTISKDLYLSILSMDAYSRGYHTGLDDLGDASDGSVHIGLADVSFNITDAGIFNAAEASSFYAIAYTMGGNSTTGIANGTTIISYRGTDQPFMEFIPVDLPISYGGSYDQRQIALAQQFFNSVQQNGNAPDIDPAIMLLTGHSLGGAAAALRMAQGRISPP
jgi:hypothetical protein